MMGIDVLALQQRHKWKFNIDRYETGLFYLNVSFLFSTRNFWYHRNHRAGLAPASQAPSAARGLSKQCRWQSWVLGP